MNRTISQSVAPTQPKPRIVLPGLPRGPLTSEQQLEALQRVQTQAEQRMKLGTQLFKAAQAHTAKHQQLIAEIRAEQEKLREQVQHDVAKSLQTYDQWMGRIDESFTRSIQSLDKRIERLESQWQQTEQRISTMMNRTQRMVEQSQALLYAVTARALKQPKPAAPAPAAVIAAPSLAPAAPAADKTPIDDRVSKTNMIYQQLLGKLRDMSDSESGTQS